MTALVKAINISDRSLCLSTGVVMPGDTIECTQAELSTLTDYLDPVPADVTEKTKAAPKGKYEAPTVESKPIEAEAEVKKAK